MQVRSEVPHLQARFRELSPRQRASCLLSLALGCRLSRPDANALAIAWEDKVLWSSLDVFCSRVDIKQCRIPKKVSRFSRKEPFPIPLGRLHRNRAGANA